MHLRLISFALCPFVHRSTTLLREKGIAFDVDYVDLTNKPQWFLEISPRGKVPVLVVDGAPLFESAAINEFLDETHPPAMIAADPIVRARQRAFVEVVNDLFSSQYKVMSLAATKEQYAVLVAANDEVLARFEAEVKGPFFGGEAFGLVDAAAAPALYRFSILEARSGVPFLRKFPKVEAWSRLVSGRPSVRGGVLPDFEDRFVESVAKKNTYFTQTFLKRAG